MAIIKLYFDERFAEIESSGRYKYWEVFKEDFENESLPYELKISRVPCVGEKIGISGHEWVVTEVMHSAYKTSPPEGSTIPRLDAEVYVRLTVEEDEENSTD